jgi:hypothetical protein
MSDAVTDNLKELELTEATRFVLPMLYATGRNDSYFITPQFNNCYIGDINHPELGAKIFLLYDYKMTVKFVQFERSLELMSSYNTDYDYADEHQVMYVFDVPEEHEHDFRLFLEGKYSEFSETLKDKILKFWGFKEGSLFHSLLYKTDRVLQHWAEQETDYTLTATEGEYWPKPVLSKETFMNPD